MSRARAAGDDGDDDLRKVLLLCAFDGNLKNVKKGGRKIHIFYN